MRQPPRVTTIELGKLMEIQASADQAAELREELKKANLANQLADKILVKALDDRHAALDRAEKAEAALAEAQEALKDKIDMWRTAALNAQIQRDRADEADSNIRSLEQALVAMTMSNNAHRTACLEVEATNATLSARVKELEEELAKAKSLIDLSHALDRERASVIARTVQHLSIGGSKEESPTPFQAGFLTACEEIAHRLEHEDWELSAALNTTGGE